MDFFLPPLPNFLANLNDILQGDQPDFFDPNFPNFWEDIWSTFGPATKVYVQQGISEATAFAQRVGAGISQAGQLLIDKSREAWLLSAPILRGIAQVGGTLIMRGPYMIFINPCLDSLYQPGYIYSCGTLKRL